MWHVGVPRGLPPSLSLSVSGKFSGLMKLHNCRDWCVESSYEIDATYYTIFRKHFLASTRAVAFVAFVSPVALIFVLLAFHLFFYGVFYGFQCVADKRPPKKEENGETERERENSICGV